MARVRLASGRTYQGLGVRATRERPFVDCDDEKAAALIAGGFFAAAHPNEPPPEPEHPAEGRAITRYDLIPLAQLRKMASELGVESKGLSRRKLADALAKATAKDLPPHEGSIAMIAMQEE